LDDLEGLFKVWGEVLAVSFLQLELEGEIRVSGSPLVGRKNWKEEESMPFLTKCS